MVPEDVVHYLSRGSFRVQMLKSRPHVILQHNIHRKTGRKKVSDVVVVSKSVWIATTSEIRVVMGT